MENIPERPRRIKRGVAGDLVVILIVILVGTAGFGLGRLSVQDVQEGEIKIINPSQAASAATPLETSSDEVVPGTIVPGGQFVASKSGTKYHFPWCPGAAQIAEKNKIWFANEEEARAAGYTPAANCKGLK